MPTAPSELRHKLDQLFAFDSIASVIFGILSLLTPHHVVTQLGGGTYNHAAHETLRYVLDLVIVGLFCILSFGDLFWSNFVISLKPLHLFSYTDSTAACDWHVDGFYGTFDASMMESFESTCARHCLYAMFCKHLPFYEPNSRIVTSLSIG